MMQATDVCVGPAQYLPFEAQHPHPSLPFLPAQAFLRNRKGVVQWYIRQGHLPVLKESEVIRVQRLFSSLGLDPYWPSVSLLLPPHPQ